MGSESGPEGNSQGGGRVKSTLCLKGGEVVLVISEGVAAVGNGFIQLLIVYKLQMFQLQGRQGRREVRSRWEGRIGGVRQRTFKARSESRER